MEHKLMKFFQLLGVIFIGWLALIGLLIHFIWFISVSHSTIEENINSDLNLVEIMGNLGSDPNEYYSDNGLAIAGMSIATNRSWKDKSTGEWRKQTDWHQVSVFGKRAEWCVKELTKGSRVRIIGRLQTDVVEDKYGQKRYYTKIIAKEISLE